MNHPCKSLEREREAGQQKSVNPSPVSPLKEGSHGKAGWEGLRKALLQPGFLLNISNEDFLTPRFHVLGYHPLSQPSRSPKETVGKLTFPQKTSGQDRSPWLSV